MARRGRPAAALDHDFGARARPRARSASASADHRWLVDAVPRFASALSCRRSASPIRPGSTIPTSTSTTSRPPAAPAGAGSDRQPPMPRAILAMTPFDKARAPWEATLIGGLEGGRAAYVLKLHHAVSDGLGIMQLPSRVFTATRRRSAAPAAGARLRSGPADDVAPPRREVARRRAQSRWPGPDGCRGGAGTPASAAWSGIRVGPRGDRVPRSAKRMVGNKPVPGSGLFRRRSLSWRSTPSRCRSRR